MVFGANTQEAVHILRLVVDEAIGRGLKAKMGRDNQSATVGPFVSLRTESVFQAQPGLRPDAVAFERGAGDVLHRRFCDEHFGRQEIFGEGS